MKTIPTNPLLIGKMISPIFQSIPAVVLVFLTCLFSSTDLKAVCKAPKAYIEIGSGVSSSLDDISEIISLNSHQFVVRGHLNINQSVYLEGYSFLMDSAAEIICNIPVKIGFAECNFAGCSDLWQGISLNSSSSLVMSNCSIADALNGIYIKPKGSGASFNIDECYFYNNIVGIRSSGIGYGVYSVSFCKFYGTKNGALNGDTPLAGIYLNHSIPGFYANGNLFEGIQNGIICLADVYNLTDNNVYKAIFNDTGIDPSNPYSGGNGSAIKIIGGVNIKKPIVKVTGKPLGKYEVGPNHEKRSENFSNCLRGVYVSTGGIGIISLSKFINCDFGVTVRNTGPLSFSKIVSNTFSNPKVLGIDFRGNLNQFGSLVQYNQVILNSSGNNDLIAAARVLATPFFESQFVNISDNTISISNGGVGIDLDGTAYTDVKGINKIQVVSGKEYQCINLHNKTNSCYISGAHMFGPDRLYSFYGTRNKIGLFVWESEDNFISCNYFNGVGTSLNVIGNCSGSIFQHNEFAGGADGLTIGNASGYGALIDDQYAAGNYWTGGYTHYNAVNYTPSCFGKFYIYPEDKLPAYDNPYWPNYGVVYGGTDFLDSSDPGAASPATGCGEGFTISGLISKIQLKIAKKDLSELPKTDYFKWSANRSLFKKLKAIPELQRSVSEVNDFINEENSSESYQIWKSGADFQDAFNMEPSLLEQIQEKQDRKESLYSVLGNLIPSWNLNTQDAAMRTEIDKYIQDITLIDQQLDEILTNWNKRFVAKVNSLKKLLETIQPSDPMDINMKIVLEIKMEMAMGPNENLNESTINILKNIADQCPLEIGDAIYVARNILKSNGIKVNEDADNCVDNATTGIAIIAPESNKVLVYPNPGSTQVEIDITGDQSGTANMVISDILGNVKITKDISGGHNRINTTDLLSGIYVITIDFKNGQKKCLSWIKE
ncbi:MAG TPA: T9SS type A sorting domain-containing protein [Saprospiraceae bacterium]|nr:T9SS type A sorting domain-containing protein [Saprospiraceae bacterium]